jgi:peptidoglycan/xylan/chitin deacetylase (PgdA/CDA1 family)
MGRGTMRSLVKGGLAGVLHRTGVDRLIGRARPDARAPLVLCYHRVVEDFRASLRGSIPAMLTSRRMLERHLDWIGRRHRFVTLDEVGARLEDGGGGAQPAAAITFDDGYRDVYDHAFPLLRRKGIPFAVFVVTDLVGTSRIPLYDRLYALLSRAGPDGRRGPRAAARGPAAPERGRSAPGLELLARVPPDPQAATVSLLGMLSQAQLEGLVRRLEEEIPLDPGELDGSTPMTWEMVSTMRRAGTVIGSHTRTHALLTVESRATARRETVESRHALQGQLDGPIEHFAYPDGRFDPGVVDLVAQAGYRFAYTICRHRVPDRPWLTIPRLPLWERACLDGRGRFSPAVLSCHVHHVFDLVSGCRRDHAGARGGAGGRGAPRTESRSAPRQEAAGS